MLIYKDVEPPFHYWAVVFSFILQNFNEECIYKIRHIM